MTYYSEIAEAFYYIDLGTKLILEKMWLYVANKFNNLHNKQHAMGCIKDYFHCESRLNCYLVIGSVLGFSQQFDIQGLGEPRQYLPRTSFSASLTMKSWFHNAVNLSVTSARLKTIWGLLLAVYWLVLACWSDCWGLWDLWLRRYLISLLHHMIFCFNSW